MQSSIVGIVGHVHWSGNRTEVLERTSPVRILNRSCEWPDPDQKGCEGAIENQFLDAASASLMPQVVLKDAVVTFQ